MNGFLKINAKFKLPKLQMNSTIYSIGKKITSINKSQIKRKNTIQINKRSLNLKTWC